MNVRLVGVVITSIIVVLFFGTCTPSTTQQLQEQTLELVWSDEFDGVEGSQPSSQYWSMEIGTGTNGWGNQELQYYTDRPKNVAQDGNGHLVIQAHQESYGGRSFTSARLKTQGKITKKYGRIEARIKNPFGPGLWPAFWMLGENFEEVGWPQSGEIDIMEMRGQLPSTIHGSIHGPGYSGSNPITQSYTLSNARFDDDFFVYAVEWHPERIDFFVDDYLYQRVTPGDVSGEWVFNQPFFLLLNVAVGGNYVGFPTQETVFPQKMMVDYVRVYSIE
ncbi:MAG: glycoside hydrolase family 16 protein [Balneolaceae bacterium]|nr:glycoside hydrolase family 16 protein [Balneolaceae bacterium]